MTYTATTAETFRTKKGSLSVKLNEEFSDIADEFTSVIATIEDSITLGGSGSSLAAAGFDVADGTGGTTYGVFVAPFDMTITGGFAVLTEAYVKDTDDAKIEIKDNASTPVLLASVTLDAEGLDVGDTENLTIDKASVSAGDILNVVVTATASGTGTGHALVVLKYRKG